MMWRVAARSGVQVSVYLYVSASYFRFHYAMQQQYKQQHHQQQLEFRVDAQTHKSCCLLLHHSNIYKANGEVVNATPTATATSNNQRQLHRLGKFCLCSRLII